MTLHDLVINFIITAGLFLVGKFMTLLLLIPKIPVELIGWFQVGSYATGIAVGLLTIYKFFKKRK
jgi:hypothetical protein